jgi:tetratricopeptide (TPR) repeat protein
LLHHANAPAAVFAKGTAASEIGADDGGWPRRYGQDLNEQAAQWLLQAIALEPANPRPYLVLGKVQEVAKSEPQEWVEAFRKFVTLRPENPWAHYCYAVALEKQRRGNLDFAAREAALRKALAIDGRMGAAYLKLGILFEERGDFAEAVAAFQKAVKDTELRDEAHLRLAQVYRRMGEAEKAQRESALYEQLAEQKKEKLERERRELGQFVFTLKSESAPAEKPAPKPQ